MATFALHRLGVRALSTLLEEGRTTSVEFVQASIDRIHRHNPAVNAIVAIDTEAALREAHAADVRARAGKRRGPLDGVPIVVKDNLFVCGFPATWGSRLFAEFRPSADDVFAERLRNSGAIILGKTNTSEFALGAYTDNLLFGPTRNPWSLEHTVGGSSGGSVAAVASGMVPLAIGTDAGGSIRRPAGYAGVVGFRPSNGQIPRVHGFPGLAFDLQSISPTGRRVDDVRLLFEAIRGPDDRDRGSRLFTRSIAGDGQIPEPSIACLLHAGGEPVDEPILVSMRQAIASLRAGGLHVLDVPAPYEPSTVARICSTLGASGLANLMERHGGWETMVKPASKAIVDRGQKLRATEYARCLAEVLAIRRELDAYFDQIDFLITPTSGCMPWKIGAETPTDAQGEPLPPHAAAAFAMFVNVGGLPAVTIPAMPCANGLPIGLQIVGRFGSDDRLLDFAERVENLLGPLRYADLLDPT